MTKEGKWVEGWYFEATAPSSNGDVVKSFIITKSWSVVYIDADEEYQFEAKCIVEVIPETVGQYTGLNDKERSRFFPHGKEIFDGDKYKDANGIISIVKMAVDGWSLFPIKKGTPIRNLYWHNVCEKTKGEIIGTIHTKIQNV